MGYSRILSWFHYTFMNSVDSVMLLDNGFEVVSVDASDKLLKTAYKIRWDRRKEPSYDRWGKLALYGICIPTGLSKLASLLK